MDLDSPARRWRLLRPLLLSAIAAALVAAAFLAWRPAPEGSPVLVTGRALVPGQELGTDAVRIVRVPQAAVPEDALGADARLPGAWTGAQIGAGVILTESNAGSDASRALGAGERQVTVAIDARQAATLRAGDVVDIWSMPTMCDQSTCSASLLASAVRITSSVVTGDPSWGPSTTTDARVSVILRVEDIDRVLGQAGTNTLNMVLRPGGAASHSSGDFP